jgi:hypothetical protein
MGRHHAVTRIVEQQPSQQMISRISHNRSSGPLIGKLLLDRIE